MESWNCPAIYVNPPYGHDRARGAGIRDWLQKCRDANMGDESEIIALVPVTPNTRHWKDGGFGAADDVAFLYDTRLRFAGRREGWWERGTNGVCNGLLGEPVQAI